MMELLHYLVQPGLRGNLPMYGSRLVDFIMTPEGPAVIAAVPNGGGAGMSSDDFMIIGERTTYNMTEWKHFRSISGIDQYNNRHIVHCLVRPDFKPL